MGAVRGAAVWLLACTCPYHARRALSDRRRLPRARCRSEAWWRRRRPAPTARRGCLISSPPACWQTLTRGPRRSRRWRACERCEPAGAAGPQTTIDKPALLCSLLVLRIPLTLCHLSSTSLPHNAGPSHRSMLQSCSTPATGRCLLLRVSVTSRGWSLFLTCFPTSSGTPSAGRPDTALDSSICNPLHGALLADGRAVGSLGQRQAYKQAVKAHTVLRCRWGSAG